MGALGVNRLANEVEHGMISHFRCAIILQRASPSKNYRASQMRDNHYE
jgi:hypothetical protein